MSKKLIINADDFGFAESINRGIIECYTRGAVTDMSLLAVGDSFDHAVELAKKNAIDKIGVHLALTGPFRPITPIGYIPSLVDRYEVFPEGYIGFLTRYLTGFASKGEIYAEFKNQILKVKKANFAITHLDSHQHMHMVPGILEVVIRLMKEENIRYVRFPLETPMMSEKLSSSHAWPRNFLLSSVCRLFHGILDKSGVAHNDYFIGHARVLRLKKKDIISRLARLKDGLTELGCHPGYLTEDVKIKYPYYINCEEELKFFCDKSFIDEIKEHSIELVSY